MNDIISRGLAGTVRGISFCLSLGALLCVSLLSPALSAGEDTDDARLQKPELRLTLEECLRRALTENLSLFAQSLDIGIAEQGVVAAEAPFDSQLGLDLMYERARSRQDPTRSDRRRMDLSWAKKIRTGQVFRITHAASRFSRDMAVPVSPFYDLEWVVSASQPLARGAGRTANMAPVWIAENDRKKALLMTQEAIMDLLFMVESAYLDLVYAIRYLDVQQSGLKLAEELLAKNERLRDIGKLPERSIEVLEAKVSIATREEGVIIAVNGIAKAEDTLRRLLNLPLGFQEGRPTLVPIDEPQVDFKIPGVQESLSFSLAHRPQVQAAKLDLDSARLELAAARNNCLPDVDLRADVGFSGSRTEYCSSFEDLAHGRNYVWQVGLSVRFPWGNRAARSRHEQAKLVHEKSTVLLKDLFQELTFDVIDAHRSIDGDIKRLAAIEVAIEQAELQLEVERERDRQGMSDSFRMLEFQDDLIEARIRHLEATIDFNKSYFRLLRVEGRGVRNERFDLTDIARRILARASFSAGRPRAVGVSAL